MAMRNVWLDALFTSPLRGEVDAYASGEGFSAAYVIGVIATAEPLTPTLSPQGRGGAGAAAVAEEEALHGDA